MTTSGEAVLVMVDERAAVYLFIAPYRLNIDSRSAELSVDHPVLGVMHALRWRLAMSRAGDVSVGVVQPAQNG
jgi:hypothetical protein